MLKTFLNYFENANLIKSLNGSKGQLWLGNCLSSTDINFIHEHNIKVIINCTPNLPFIHETIPASELVKYNLCLETIRLNVYDSLLQKDIVLMQNYLNFIVPYIKKHLENGHNVLVHCHAGRQRSACVVAAVLYQYPTLFDIKKDINYIISYILNKRPQAFSFGFRVNFKNTLEEYFKIKIN